MAGAPEVSARHNANLTLRSEQCERLEGWVTDVVRVPILRDGASRLLRMRME
jgi:hypothetical protein